jgi:tRNA 5-methylaminomethyl-2-thiouridine biosynthesis bifunctional protein
MTDTPDEPAPGEPSLDWTAEGPKSRRFGDIYFSPQDGLAESRAVFLEGCGLPDAWTGRDRFVVGELGFGTGLNILALAELWRRTAAPQARLHIFSIEAFPLEAADAARALAAWPELADLAAGLLARWPGRARGFHRLDWPELRITLDLAVMEVAEALQGWSGQADAWFLDGFAPSLNPGMWEPAVLDLVARRSAPGARAATFTVAGAVRRGLTAAGFAVEKQPGFGRKRERLEARLPGEAARRPAPRVAIVGAGIAGASAARALRALGIEPLLLEAVAPGAGASGNPAALVTPRLDAGLGPVARLAAQAFGRAVTLYGQSPEAIVARGVLQLAAGPRDPERFGKIAGSGLFEPGALAPISPEAATERLGDAAPAALDMAAALVVEPRRVLAAWAGPVTAARVTGLDRTETGWRILGDGGRPIAEAEVVILAAGLETFGFGTSLRPVRGQASWTDGTFPPAAAWGGYVLPTRTGLLFGATHDRDDTGTELRAADHQRNLETLAAALPGLAARIAGAPLEGRAALRATTSDHLPLAGAAADAPGVFLLTGFGSRGFSLAPLLAEHVAAEAAGAPSPLPRDLAELTDPGRFARRAARQPGRNQAAAGRQILNLAGNGRNIGRS